MIITIKGANFKDSNIGTLSSYTVRFNGDGVSGSPTSIAKNEEGTQASANYVGTITVSSSYTYKSVSSVTVGGTALSTSDYTVSGMNITIPANKITGNVVITVATEKVNTEPEEPGTGGGTIENKIMLYNNYTLQQNKTLGSSGISTSTKSGYHTFEMVPVEPDTAYYIPGGIRVSMLDSGQSPTKSINIWTESNVGQQCYFLTNASAAYVYITILDTKITIEDAYIQKATSTVNTVATSVISSLAGTSFVDNTKLTSSSYTESTDDAYCVWKNIPVKASTNYKVAGAARNWYLKEDGVTTISSVNPTTGGVPEKFGFITPETAAFVSISIYKSNMDKTADELELVEIETAYTPIE